MLKMKKILSVALVVFMLLTTVAISAFQGQTVIWVKMEKTRATASKTRKN